MSCASGTIAVGEAFRQVRDGYADVMISGGAEALLAAVLGAFALIRAMSTRNDDPGSASRPFDRDRDGFVMGEGSAVLILEERRGRSPAVRPFTARCSGMTDQRRAPHDGAASGRPAGARSITLALSDAESRRTTSPTSTRTAAPRHSTIPRRRWQSNACSATTRTGYPVSSTKGYYGHALGASGAIEAAICALALRNRWVPQR